MTALNQLSSYGLTFQIKVLASLLKHKEFIQTIHDVLDEDYFDNPAHKWIIKELLRYYYKYHNTPTLDSLKIEVKKIENEILKTTVVEQLKEAYKTTYEDREYVEQEFSNFCKNQQLKKALLSSVDLLNQGNYDEIRTLIDSALKAGQDKNIGHEYDIDILSRYAADNVLKVPTQWSIIDKLLGGGLRGGDLGLILGNPGGGKSWSLIHLGGVGVLQGLTVVHYTLELSETYVGQRYDAFFTAKPVQEIVSYQKEVQDVVDKLPGKLIIKEYPMGRVTTSTIESHIRKCTDLGFKPDLVIIDYVDLLKSKKRSTDRKEEIDDVFIATKGLARELNVPIWTVSQVNRAGAKDDIIEGDKIAGSYDKVAISDFAMSLSRKRLDKTQGTGRYHIMKNRYGRDGMTFAATLDTSTGNIQIEETELDSDIEISPGTKTEKISLLTKEEKNLLIKKFYELEGVSKQG